jgi:hypothetical protein
MKRSYVITVLPLQKQFVVLFHQSRDELLANRKITTCTIVEFPKKQVYSGATICNPKDIENETIAFRWAFKRAVLQLWIVWCEMKKTGMCYSYFWQLFRKALGENPTYLEERKKKNV